MTPCPACGFECPQAELNHHMASCRAARSRMSHIDPHVKALRAQVKGGDGRVASQAAPLPVAAPLDDGRVPCARCGRKFAPERIIKHQFICAGLKRGPAKPAADVARAARLVTASSNGITSRPVAAGPRGVAALRMSRGKAVGQKGGSEWRRQSYELRASIRAARAAPTARPLSRGGASTIPFADMRSTPLGGVLEPCPHCGRTFAAAVWERHVPKCEHTIARPKGLGAPRTQGRRPQARVEPMSVSGRRSSPMHGIGSDGRNVASTCSSQRPMRVCGPSGGAVDTIGLGVLGGISPSNLTSAANPLSSMCSCSYWPQ